MRKQVEIFTDGSCLGNPGPGGYGAIMRYRQHEKTFSEGYFLTTNNRMELMAAIVALEALKEHCDVVLAPTASTCVRDHPVDPQLEKTRLENGIRNRSRTSISGSALMPRWASTRSNGNGLKATPVIRKTNAVTNWRAAAANPAHEDAGYQPES
jgi:ribonuclease HI